MSETDNEKMNFSGYAAHLVQRAKNPKHLGRMNAPTASAFLKGPCGDEIEFYLIIENKVIQEAKFFCDGCVATAICADATAELAEGKNIDDALGISPRRVKNVLKGLPQDHSHCSILAVSALYRAIADYLLKA